MRRRFVRIMVFHIIVRNNRTVDGVYAQWVVARMRACSGVRVPGKVSTTVLVQRGEKGQARGLRSAQNTKQSRAQNTPAGVGEPH